MHIIGTYYLNIEEVTKDFYRNGRIMARLHRKYMTVWFPCLVALFKFTYCKVLLILKYDGIAKILDFIYIAWTGSNSWCKCKDLSDILDMVNAVK